MRNKGGHSARPVPDNAIYHLVGALYRLSSFAFPFHLNEVTRAYFEQMAKIEKGPLAADLAKIAAGVLEDAMRGWRRHLHRMEAAMRTTCVATQLEGGHATMPCPNWRRRM